MTSLDTMKNYTFSRQRDTDLRRTARHILSKPDSVNLTGIEVARLAVEQKAPEYYVSIDHVELMLRRRRQGRMPQSLCPLRRAMYDEIAARTAPLMLRGMTMRQAITEVLDRGNASRFFISPKRALAIINPRAKH